MNGRVSTFKPTNQTWYQGCETLWWRWFPAMRSPTTVRLPRADVENPVYGLAAPPHRALPIKNDRLDKHPSNKGNHVTFMIQPTMEQRIVCCWWSTSFPSITYYILQQWRRISRKHKNNGRRQQQQGLPRVTVCGKLPNGARGRNAWWYLMSADNNSNRSFCEERCPYISRMPQLLDFI